MTEQEWLQCSFPYTMLMFLNGKASERKLQLFGCACCRRLWHLIVDEQSQKALEIAELLADGRASQGERRTALDAILAPLDSTEHAWGYDISPNTAVFGGAMLALLIDGSVGDRWTGKFLYGTGDGTGLGTIYRAIAIHQDTSNHAAHEAVRQREAGLWPVSRWLLRAIAPVYRWAVGYWHFHRTFLSASKSEWQQQVVILRDIFGNPFRPVTINSAWLTPIVQSLAQSIYDNRTFDQLPHLADQLAAAGCDSADILNHCRQPGVHVRGCWVVDLVLGKE